MLTHKLPIALFFVISLAQASSMIMRNNALMSKMVSKFQGKERTNENVLHEPRTDKPANVVSMMQNVLCRNFPSIPCEIITKDPTLRHLIQKSVQQIKYKKLTLDRTTLPPSVQLTLFPVINSEDLSNFLQESPTGFYPQKTIPHKKAKKSVTGKNFWSHEATPSKKESKTSVFNGRKKLRKFYPHKIKYKDKNERKEFIDYSDEKLSMSVENPESHGVRRKHFSYKTEPSDPPVWRIDYMKHGEPSFNMFGGYNTNLKEKLIQTGPNVVDEHLLEQVARKDVLHPDVYIKKNYVRKNSDFNSEGAD